MSFLSKFGQVVSTIGGVATNYNPLIGFGLQLAGGLLPKDSEGQKIVQAVSADLPQIVSIIGTVEAVGQVIGSKGPDKLKMATPLVAQALLQSSVVAGHKIANQALFQQAAQKFADATADLLNSLDEKSLKVTEIPKSA